MIVHTGNGGGRVSENYEYRKLVPACSRGGVCLRCSGLGPSKRMGYLRARHISPLLFKNGLQAAGEHDRRIDYDQVKQLCCRLHVGCKGKSGGFKKKVEKEGKRGKLQKF